MGYGKRKYKSKRREPKKPKPEQVIKKSVVTGYYTGAITADDIRAAKPDKIFYSQYTCWWTHDPDHLYRERMFGFPCGPLGEPLLEARDVDKWFSEAEANAAHYGRHGLRAFMAAHHLNCVQRPGDNRPMVLAGWEQYNLMLDEWDKENS